MKKNKALVYIILAGIFWGTSGIFVHFMAPYRLTSLQMTAVRGIVAAVCMATYMFAVEKSAFKITKKQAFLFVCSGIAMFATAACYFISMQAASVSTAVVLMYTAPVMVMAFSVVFWGEKLTFVKGLSVIGMLVGCGLVSGMIGGMKFSFYGVFMGLMSGVAYAVYNILTKLQVKQGCNPLASTTYNFIVMGVLATAVCDPADVVNNVVSNAWPLLPMVLAVGVVTCVLPYFLYTLSLKSLPVGTASALCIIEPMAATVFSVVLFHEPLGFASLAGIVLILGSVLMLSQTKS